MKHFVDRLSAAIRRTGNAVCVGLDPRVRNLPAGLVPIDEADPSVLADAYAKFCIGVVDVVASLVPIVKPQAAFFEELGPGGMNALADVIDHARSRGLLILLDGKRNDIGSTAEAYARGYLGNESAWRADALTVSPYLGDDSLAPFVEVAQKRGAGIFVLVKTSNPGGGMLQDLQCNGQAVYARVAAQVEQFSRSATGQCGYGAVGAVVGATYPAQLVELRQAMPHSWFLVPGYGSQGGTAADVAPAFDENGLGAIVNNSRGLIFAHERPEFSGRFGSNWQAAVEAATREMIEALRSAGCSPTP
jgi:orotidine-5'-phosphate decarboxylase